METFSEANLTTVLNYGPRSAHEHEKRGRVYLLWPAFAWRVVAPEPDTRRINMFQKAVLGLCRAGSYCPEEMAPMLHLHPRLIETLGRELVGFGWIDAVTGRPTEAGLLALRESEEVLGSQVSGWVFQDPWTGELWPHFAVQLRLQEMSSKASSSELYLVVGSPAKCRHEAVLRIDGPENAAQPSTEAVLRAVRRHKRRASLKGYLALLPIGADEQNEEATGLKSLQRISFVSSAPEPVDLVTYGYVPKAGVLQPQICDPFGFGASEELWCRLEGAAVSSRGAQAAVEELLDRSCKAAGPDFREQLALQRKIAEAEVVEQLSINIRQYPAVFEHWVTVLLNRAQALASQGHQKGPLASVMASGRKTIEAVFKVLASKFPIKDMHLLFVSMPLANQPILEQAACAIGFTIPLPFPLVSPGKGPPDKRSLRRAGSSAENFYMLPSVLVATILCASRDSSHPLRTAARADSQLLVKICRIIELGNAGSHDDSHSRNSTPISLDAAEEMRELLRHVTILLLGLSHN